MGRLLGNRHPMDDHVSYRAIPRNVALKRAALWCLAVFVLGLLVLAYINSLSFF
jgi:hypothetical protein